MERAESAACGYRIVLSPRGSVSQTCALPAGHDGPHSATIPDAVAKLAVREREGAWGDPYEEAMVRDA